MSLRYALRSLRSHFGFSIIAVSILALAIGASGAMFSVLNAVVLRPLPYRNADRLAVIWKIVPKKDHEWDYTSYPTFADWRRQTRAFNEIALASRPIFFTVLAKDVSEQVNGMLVSANFFSMLGVAPELGRYYTSDEERQSAQVIVVSHAFWQSWFGGRPEALGQSIDVNGRRLRLIGVMPPEFRFPSKQVQFWGLITADQRWPKWQTIRLADAFFGLGHLQPRLGFDQAQADMSAISRRLERAYPDTDAGLDVRVVPLPLQIAGAPLRRALWLLFAAVLFVLLIACLNIAGLFLVRCAARQREFALRAALGATRARLIRQLLAEGALVAAAACLLGLALSVAGTRALIAFGPPDILRLDQTYLDSFVLAFILVLTVLSVLVFALAPAWSASQTALSSKMTRARRNVPGRFLVIAELALSMMLLTGAGLLIRSFLQIEQVDPGFHPERVLTMKVTLPDDWYSKDRATAFFNEAIRRVAALPGVNAAAIGGVFSGDRLPNVITILEDRPTEIDASLTGGFTVSDRYFELLGIPLLRGRLFSDIDRQNSPGVAIVNQAMARKFWPGEDPIGKRFKQTLPGNSASSRWFTVIGVAGDTVANGLESRVIPEVYVSHRQMSWAYRIEFLVRTSTSDPLQLADAVTRALRSIDKRALRSGVSTIQAGLDALNARRRFETSLVALFGAIALILTAIGVFGLIHYSVSQRTAELGIRMALGAQPRSLLAMVLRQGLVLGFLGVALGLIGSFWTTRMFASWLYGVSAYDPFTLAAVSALLLAVAVAACYVPARRAASIDPILALRSE